MYKVTVEYVVRASKQFSFQKQLTNVKKEKLAIQKKLECLGFQKCEVLSKHNKYYSDDDVARRQQRKTPDFHCCLFLNGTKSDPCSFQF